MALSRERLTELITAACEEDEIDDEDLRVIIAVCKEELAASSNDHFV